MNDTRRKWLETLERYRLNPDLPETENYWSAKLDTASVDELRAIQSEKLRVATQYAMNTFLFTAASLTKVA